MPAALRLSPPTEVLSDPVREPVLKKLIEAQYAPADGLSNRPSENKLLVALFGDPLGSEWSTVLQRADGIQKFVVEEESSPGEWVPIGAMGFSKAGSIVPWIAEKYRGKGRSRASRASRLLGDKMFDAYLEGAVPTGRVNLQKKDAIAHLFNVINCQIEERSKGAAPYDGS